VRGCEAGAACRGGGAATERLREPENVGGADLDEGLVSGRDDGLVSGRDDGLVSGRDDGLVSGRPVYERCAGCALPLVDGRGASVERCFVLDPAAAAGRCRCVGCADCTVPAVPGRVAAPAALRPALSLRAAPGRGCLAPADSVDRGLDERLANVRPAPSVREVDVRTCVRVRTSE